MGVSAIANTKIVTVASTAADGTITVDYPTGFVQADLTGSTGGKMVYKSGEVINQVASTGGVTFTFGASNITVTNKTGAAIPAGTYYLSFGSVDINGAYNVTWPLRVQNGALT